MLVAVLQGEANYSHPRFSALILLNSHQLNFENLNITRQFLKLTKFVNINDITVISLVILTKIKFYLIFP